MLHICIDAGNTALKFALFDGDELISEGAEAELSPALGGLNDSTIPQGIISSSGAAAEGIAQRLVALSPVLASTHWHYLSPASPLPFENTYLSATVGADRLAGVAGAQGLFPKQPCLIIDLGTCITYDLLTADGRYLGGAISPGMNMRAQAMQHYTARLPLVDLAAEMDWLSAQPIAPGRETLTCLASGAWHGVLFEMQGYIQAYTQYLQKSPTDANLQVILTGGDSEAMLLALNQSPALAPETAKPGTAPRPSLEIPLNRRIFASRNLVLRGLNRILLYHASLL
jgi:type III pantothenate kinase